MNLQFLNDEGIPIRCGLVKKVVSLFAMAFLFCIPQSGAQTMPYTFSSSSGVFTALTGTTSLASGTSMDNNTYLINLPFSFKFNGTAYTKLYVSVNGYIGFGTTNPGTGTTSVISGSTVGYQAAAVFSGDLQGSSSASRVSYGTTGITPHRIFSVEWKKLQFYGDTGQSFTFQVKLNETSNVLQFVYGTMTNTGASGSVQVGLRGNDSTTFFNSVQEYWVK